MTLLRPASDPCASCPYRRDVEPGIWAASEYDRPRPARRVPMIAGVHGDLAVLVPSRGRPASVAALVERLAQTVTAATALIVAVDLDDPAADEYATAAAAATHLPGLLAFERTTGPADALNLVACRYAPAVRHVMFLPDAWRPVNPGWDTALVAALDSGAGMAYGREDSPERALPRHVAVRCEVVQTLGYLAPAGMPCGAWPDVWAVWGRHCGARAVPGAQFTRDPAVARRKPGVDERVVAEVAAWAQYRRSGRAERDEQALAALAQGWRAAAPAGQ